jgi:hypothetical protein
MEPEGSLLHSQEPATCPYPEPYQSISTTINMHAVDLGVVSALKYIVNINTVYEFMQYPATLGSLFLPYAELWKKKMLRNLKCKTFK